MPTTSIPPRFQGHVGRKGSGKGGKLKSAEIRVIRVNVLSETKYPRCLFLFLSDKRVGIYREKAGYDDLGGLGAEGDVGGVDWLIEEYGGHGVEAVGTLCGQIAACATLGETLLHFRVTL